MGTLIITSIIAFISTNLDDLFLITLFFSQSSTKNNRQTIIISQFIGIYMLLIGSMVGGHFLVSFDLLPIHYIGVIPLLIGVYGIVGYMKHKQMGSEKDAIEFKKISLVPLILITLSNGSDNLSVYLPLFSHINWLGVIVVLMTFGVMVCLWCFLGYVLSSNHLFRRTLEKTADWLVPVIYLILGCLILFS